MEITGSHQRERWALIPPSRPVSLGLCPSPTGTFSE